MSQAKNKWPTFSVTTSQNHEYEIDAPDEATAQKIGERIDAEIAKGNTALENVDWGTSLPVEVRHTQDVAANTPTSSLGSVSDGLLQGTTFNFGDEITAFGNAAGLAPVDRFGGYAGQKAFWEHPDGFWGAYEQNLRDARDRIDAERQQNPGLYAAGNVAGSLLGAGKLAKAGGAALNVATKVAPKLVIPAVGATEAALATRPVTQAALAGGGYGAVAGAGEGDTLDSRVQSGITGAVGGAAVSGALGAAITKVAPAVASYMKMLAGRATPEIAMQQVIQALARDGYDVTSPTGVQALRMELSKYTDKPVSLADVGNATRARAGVGLRAPSDAQSKAIDTVTGREQSAGSRIIRDIQQTVSPRTDVHTLEDALVAQREAEALPLKQQALFTQGPGFGSPALSKQPLVTPTGLAPEAVDINGDAVGGGADAGLRRMLGLNVPEAAPTFSPIVPTAENAVETVGRQAVIPRDPQLQQLARLPFAQRGLTNARNLAQNEVSLGLATGQDVSHLPDVTATGADLDMRTLDYLKRYLDREVHKLGRGADGDTYKAAEYPQVKALRDAIRNRMRLVQPDGTIGETDGPYGQYLDLYKGSSDLIDALEAGQSFRNLSPETIAAEQAGRSTGEREFYRSGAGRSLVDLINKTPEGASASRRIPTDPNTAAQISALGDGADNLLTRLSQERTLSKLTDELRGSQTQTRGAAAADADVGNMTPNIFNPTQPMNWVLGGIRAMNNSLRPQRNAAVNEQVLPMLLEQDPAAIEATITKLINTGQKQKAEELRRSWLSMQVAKIAGSLNGTMEASPERNTF